MGYKPPGSKGDPRGNFWGPKTQWVAYHPTATINAPRAVARLLLRFPPMDEHRYTPLLRLGDGRPLTGSRLDAWFRPLLRAGCPDADAALYFWHSYRAYLAVAMRAAVDDARVERRGELD